MSGKRKIEVFSAGCSACEDTIELVNSIACPSCEISVLNMSNKDVSERARSLGISRVPAVVIDGELAACCASGAVVAETLKNAGLGQER